MLCGTDVLDSSRDDFEQALQRLRNGTDVVLGPVADGGYWLLGVREDHPALFKDIAWSTSRVFEQSVAACSHLSLYALPVRHDLDRGRDLLRQRSRACSRSSPAT